MYILNAFSANMLSDFPVSVNFTEISVEHAALMLACIEADGDSFESAVGHADTAAVFSAVLSAARHGGGIEVACNRVTVTLRSGESALLGQYSGPRLPEGATELPDGAAIKWLMIVVA
jgi:hypothetical protein